MRVAMASASAPPMANATPLRSVTEMTSVISPTFGPLVGINAPAGATLSCSTPTCLANAKTSKDRKGANLDRIEDKIRSTALDREMRLEDVDRKYRLGVEVALVQLAIVSYPKVIVPVRLEQGKDQKLGVAVWDPLVHQGYFYALSQ